jgi:hypothetical protein
MKLSKRLLCAITTMLCLFVCITSHAAAATAVGGVAGEQVKVPISLQIPYNIAGAEFEISYTSGLTFVEFEKSEAIASAMTTPVVAKDNGKTYLGFFTAENEYAPVDGWLDVGFLTFEYNGEPEQSVTVTQAKFVQVVDKTSTNSETLIINEQIAVPGGVLKVGKPINFVLIGAIAAAVLVIAGATVLVQKNRKLKAKLAAATGGAADVAVDAPVSEAASENTDTKE